MIPIRLWSVVVSHASQPRGSGSRPGRTSLGTCCDLVCGWFHQPHPARGDGRVHASARLTGSVTTQRPVPAAVDDAALAARGQRRGGPRWALWHCGLVIGTHVRRDAPTPPLGP